MALQLSLTESEVSKMGTIKVEGIINPTNAELDLKDGVGEECVLIYWEAVCKHPAHRLLLSGTALEKVGGRDFLEGVKELRKSQGPLEVATGKVSG